MNPVTLGGLLFETKKRPICISERDKLGPMGDKRGWRELYCSGF